MKTTAKHSNKPPPSPSPPQIVASMDDLLIEIFLRLPLKPLIRLKLVSDHWNSIISTSRFSILRNPSPNPAVGLIFQFYTNSYNCSKPLHVCVVSIDKSAYPRIRTLDPVNRRDCEALNSCNGLLLCRSTRFRSSHARYYVGNPTTNKYFMLPLNDERVNKMRRSSRMDSSRTCLAFDPSNSPHYKVVYAQKHHRHGCQFMVYSSETGHWRKRGEPFTANVDFYHGVYWNGAVHWISFVKSGESIYFNPDHDEAPKAMPTPPIADGHDLSMRHNYFGESCDHLHYIDEYWTVTVLNVWEMRRDYSEWFVKCRVDLTFITRGVSFVLGSVVRGKKDEDSFLVLRIGEKMVRQNLVDKTCETICELEGKFSGEWYSRYFLTLEYIESLCCV